MLKIGEFSKIARVTIKTLRYYDRMRLLKPAHIDRFTGYRYYTLSQLPRLNRILALKDLDFSLDQISELLKLDLSSDAMQNMLGNKASELRQRIVDDQSRLLRVETRLRLFREGSQTPLPPVVLKSAPHLLVATVRETIPDQHLLVEWQQDQWQSIRAYLEDQQTPPQGPAFLIYHQDEFRDTNLDIETGWVIRKIRENAGDMPDRAPIRIHTLHGANHMATAVHIQETGLLPETYTLLADWVQSNGFRPIGSWRELYHQSTDDQGRTFVEVQRPVMKASDFYSQLEDQKMEPKIVKKEGFTLVGLRYFGRNENNEIAEMWGEFNRKMEDLGGLPYETGEAAIGLCITPEDAPEDGAFEYVAGLPVTKVEDIPEGFVVREMPPYTYAVFAHKGDMPSLAKTYEYIYETWLPQSGYKLAAKIDFEYYNEEFKNFSPDSVFYIYLPIERA
jgi:predicted transcriptional regulator YdeE/DNA-binding transcriptional MerR regulator